MIDFQKDSRSHIKKKFGLFSRRDCKSAERCDLLRSARAYLPDIRVHTPRTALLFFGICWIFLSIENAEAYIGPGAGFAFAGSFLVLLLSFFLALFFLITFPIRMILKLFKKSKRTKTGIDKVVIVGLDGLDHKLTTRLMEEGKLPHFKALSDEGCFYPLESSCPPISPVAWSCFQTGSNPGRHGIYDFLSRDTKTYTADLSSSRVLPPKRALSLGKFLIPLGKPRLSFLRKSESFWSILGKKDVFSTILRVPVTFPPEKFKGLLLSGMCVPDLKGTQGTFTLFTSGNSATERPTGGAQVSVEKNGNVVRGNIPGPKNFVTKASSELTIPFTAQLNPDKQSALLVFNGQKITLEKGAYSPWVKLAFKALPGFKVSGIVRFLLNSVSPEFNLYMTPINVDPEKPSLPVSHPYAYSVYLSKLQGEFATLGLAEDTWALNEKAIDDAAFANQCYTHHRERETMFFNALKNTKEGLVVCVFDTTDRMQHMFWRYQKEDHPAGKSDRDESFSHAIEDVYVNMDEMLGRIQTHIDNKTTLIVMSDHGFNSFHRCCNMNTWLYKNGYLALKNGKTTGGEWFSDVDWSRTKAYAFGLGGIYINEKGREQQGIVRSGKEKEALKKELIARLEGLRDEETGEVAVTKVYDAADVYRGPYTQNAIDLVVGYNRGYRASWESVTGAITEKIFEDNMKKWSGDHCIDPAHVPGVLFCNRTLKDSHPAIIDVAPTVLTMFGVDTPKFMDGKSLYDNS